MDNNPFIFAFVLMQGCQHSQMVLWVVASVFITLLGACFIANCLVTHHNFVCCRRGTNMFKLPEYHRKLTCIRQTSGQKGDTWNCCPAGWRASQSNCFFPFNDNMTWADSERNCSGMGAHLASIVSDAEQRNCGIYSLCGISSNDGAIFYSSLQSQCLGHSQTHWTGSGNFLCYNFTTKILNEIFSYLIGLKSENARGQWRWIDGTPFNPRKALWHENELNNIQKEDCAVLVHDRDIWGWNDFPCNLKTSRICKIPGAVFM